MLRDDKPGKDRRSRRLTGIAKGVLAGMAAAVVLTVIGLIVYVGFAAEPIQVGEYQIAGPQWGSRWYRAPAAISVGLGPVPVGSARVVSTTRAVWRGGGFAVFREEEVK
jgi:hypothetical protein